MVEQPHVCICLMHARMYVSVVCMRPSRGGLLWTAEPGECFVESKFSPPWPFARLHYVQIALPRVRWQRVDGAIRLFC